MAERRYRMSMGMRDWGAQLRADRQRRRGLRGRGAAVGILALALGATVLLPPQPILVWNASASAPIGLYGVDARARVEQGDMVIAHVPDRWRSLAGARRYVPVNIPLVKRVAAASGDTVCALGHEIFVDGRRVAGRRTADGHGRPMPWWSGCVTLRSGALFLLMDSPDSFDGRYFGPTAHGDVIGRASAIWTR